VLLVLIGPMAAALTREGIPHALRTLGTAPFFCVLAVLGWRDLWRLATRKWPGLGVLRQKTLSLVVCGLLLLNSVPFGIRYFGSQPRDGAFSWQYGVRDGLETASPALQAGIPMVGCSVVGGRVLGAWYLLQLDQAVRKGPGIQYPLEEGPFGVSPAELDRTNGGLPRIYLAIPGLDPIPGGLRLPIWYRGYGSGDGKNPTLMELHINPAAVQLMRAGTVAVQP
jgi:hypothetical protein